MTKKAGTSPSKETINVGTVENTNTTEKDEGGKDFEKETVVEQKVGREV